MKDCTTLLISTLGEIGHSLRNIETVFKGATEELCQNEDPYLLEVGNDSNIALGKLSKLSRSIALFEEKYAFLSHNEKKSDESLRLIEELCISIKDNK